MDPVYFFPFVVKVRRTNEALKPRSRSRWMAGSWCPRRDGPMRFGDLGRAQDGWLGQVDPVGSSGFVVSADQGGLETSVAALEGWLGLVDPVSASLFVVTVRRTNGA